MNTKVSHKFYLSENTDFDIVFIYKNQKKTLLLEELESKYPSTYSKILISQDKQLLQKGMIQVLKEADRSFLVFLAGEESIDEDFIIEGLLKILLHKDKFQNQMISVPVEGLSLKKISSLFEQELSSLDISFVFNEPKVFTSYFAMIKKIEETDLIPISISRFTPKWLKGLAEAKYLAPSADLLNKYKQELIDDKGYSEIYKRETLDPVNKKEAFKQLAGHCLLCYEKSDDFCHRQITAEWFKEDGFLAEEKTF